MGGHGGHKEVYRMNIPEVQKETDRERGARPLPAYNLKHKVTNLGRGGWLISCDDRWGAVVTRLSEAVESGSPWWLQGAGSAGPPSPSLLPAGRHCAAPAPDGRSRDSISSPANTYHLKPSSLCLPNLSSICDATRRSLLLSSPRLSATCHNL